MGGAIKDIRRDWRYIAVLLIGTMPALIGTILRPSLWPILLLTFVASIVGIVANVLVQRWNVRRMGGGDSSADLSVTQKRLFLLEMPFEDAFGHCVASIHSLRGGRLGRCDRGKGLIEGRTAWSWHSIGDQIRYSLTREDDRRTRVELVSHPLFHATLLDYGTNYDNAERLTAALGIKPEQYLLRASRVTDHPGELLQAVSGPGTNSVDLLRAAPSDDASTGYRPEQKETEQEQTLKA